MLGSNRVYWALALVATAALGCSSGNSAGTGAGGQGGTTTSTSSSTSSTSSSTGGGGGGGGDAGPSCPPDQATVLAVTKLFLGEGDNGQWKKVGFNVDDKASTSLSTGLCQPSSGGDPVMAYPDGDQGIDNSFGKNLLPTILALYPTWVLDINAGIQNGLFTVLLKLECLPPTGDAPVLTTKLFGGTTLKPKPKFDGTDKWPILPELLSDPTDPSSSTIIFDKSSVLNNAFDSGKDVTVILTVPLATETQSTSIKLALYAARLTMTLSEDRKSATGGMIGGVLNTEEFVAEIKKVGALVNLCESSMFTNLVNLVRQSSDILADGTQDPTKTCDGISMGIGFEMKEAQIGDVGPAAPKGESCP